MNEVIAEIAGQGWSMCENGSVLCVAVEDTISVYELKNLQNVKRISTEGDNCGILPEISEESARGCDYIRRCEFMQDSDVMCVGYFSGVCDVLNIEKGIRLDRLQGADSEVKGVGFSADGRLGFSTRDGSVWVWKLNEEGEWEIEEVIEYSESDVKTIAWHQNRLVTVGYSNEVVVYSRWEDEMCEVKWEIESTFKCESCVWDVGIAEGESTRACVVTQGGYMHVYALKQDGGFFEELSQRISEYPVISVCVGECGGEQCFAMIVERCRLVCYSMEGSCLGEWNILTEWEEPVDILYSRAEKAFFVLSYKIQARKRTSILRKVAVSRGDGVQGVQPAL
ncbi:uncharacterized protein NEMAJ01_2047 [Nematocida major]|uniref:uncharacterized protein n=1 Tax=Nematocida major TaxID=1912982 RepID=UPI002007B5CB|nr:uncharacterized protein NEMAJ01_2047 [Nematocida major]KAH9387151.1 hypothetical protein NEMAJ01_2047 [Nematocida major]